MTGSFQGVEAPGFFLVVFVFRFRRFKQISPIYDKTAICYDKGMIEVEIFISKLMFIGKMKEWKRNERKNNSE